MPTFAPVPSTFSSLSRKHQIIHLYRHILKEGSRFFDERASHWIKTTAQEKFKKHAQVKDDARIQKYHVEARRALRLLERGNQMDFKSVQRILRQAYSINGVGRKRLLQPFMDSARARTATPEKLASAIASSSRHSNANINTIALQPIPAPEPLYFRKQRTIPPIYSPPMTALITTSLNKDIHPKLPQPLFKPLHGRREANLRWRYFAKQTSKIPPLLPRELRLEMELKANIGLPSFAMVLQENKAILEDAESTGIRPDQGTLKKTKQEWSAWEENILATIKAWTRAGQEQKAASQKNGPFHPSIGGKPARGNTLTPRLYRRMWQHVLTNVLMMDVQGSEPVNSNSASNQQFIITKSQHAYNSRYKAGLKLQATVNDFDKLGYVAPQAPPSKSTSRSKKNTSKF
ncbi:hypothetical protein BGZ94_001846 [Podila epigama]|nr:hypothetical protein BGZ94_001846 [Podila epigama]